jgi:hypothetical protein
MKLLALVVSLCLAYFSAGGEVHVELLPPIPRATIDWREHRLTLVIENRSTSPVYIAKEALNPLHFCRLRSPSRKLLPLAPASLPPPADTTPSITLCPQESTCVRFCLGQLTDDPLTNFSVLELTCEVPIVTNHTRFPKQWTKKTSNALAIDSRTGSIR